MIEAPLYPYICGGAWWHMFSTDKRPGPLKLQLTGTLE
jgi:hypothetical protein